MLCSSSTTDRRVSVPAKHEAVLGLGTNLGNKEENLRRATGLIAEKVGEVARCSSVIATKPWGFRSENDFLNECLVVETSLTPQKLLETTQLIERLMGRREKSHDGEYHDRIIDIDILLYDDLHVEEPELTIPHPRMRERDFVMVPLKELGLL